jgi:hypothetical protein
MTDTDNENGLILEAMGKIHIGLGKLKDSMDERNRLQKLASRTMQPVFYVYSDTCVCAGAGFGVIRLAGPDQGHVWYVHGTGVWAPANGPGIGAPGAADVFISASDLRPRTALNQFSGIDWRDHYANFLNTHLYSRNQIVARFNEEVYVVISNGTNGLQYAAACWIQDFEEGANPQAWAM